MALMDCLECKSQMSDKAASCPRCGWIPFSQSDEKRTEREANQPPFVLVGMVGAGVGAALYFTGAGGIYGMMGGMIAMLAGGGLFAFGLLRK
jgi:hypothetical protein